MIRLIALLAIAVALAGCESEIERNARHDRTCQSYGAKPGTPEYIQCRATIHVAEVQKDEADANAAMMIGFAASSSINSSAGSRR